MALQDAELVQQWNNAFLEAIRQESSAPGLASRKVAILHGAMFEAVNAVDRKYTSYLDLEVVPASLNPKLVAIGVAMRIGELEYPVERGSFRALKMKQLKAIGTNDAASLRFGSAVADRFLKLRSDDGSSHSITYIPRDEIGIWRRTPSKYRPPETPQWAYVRPFCMPEDSDLMAPGPPSLSSQEYAEALKEIRDYGGKVSPYRTEDQTETAWFWSCFTYTATPAGHWNEIAFNLLVERDVPLLESLRLMALMNYAMADAGIFAWKAKYGYHFWRPYYAVRQADQDGNPLTQSVPDWESLLEAPPHPEYVSGHSTYTSAGAEILRRFFGTDNIAFTATSDSLPGVTRSFTKISDCEREIGMSRIYGGIHFIFSNLDGLDLGHRIGEEVFENYLRPR